MEIKEYTKPADLETAFGLLVKAKPNIILGGCTFLKRTRKKVGTAIDLRDCGLSYIRDTGHSVTIGAYTPLREVETSELVLNTFGTILQETMEHLIGVQLRNAITIGGHVYGRFGFSDILPALLSLNARVRLYHQGEMSLWNFLSQEKIEKDILMEVILPKEGRRSKIQMMRSSFNDYSIFCLAASRSTQGNWIVAAGVFPGRAKLVEPVMDRINRKRVTKSQAAELAEEIAESFTFGSNYRGSAEYRKELCVVFARRALEELADED